MNNCRNMREAIARASDGRLAVERVLELEAHTATCPGCRRLYAESRALEQALHTLPGPPLEGLDLERSLREIHARIGAQNLPQATRSLRRRALVFSKGGLAALLVGSLCVWWYLAAETDQPAARHVAEPSPPQENVAPTLDSMAALQQDALAQTEDSPSRESLLNGALPQSPAESQVAHDLQPVRQESFVTDFDRTRHAWACAEVERALRQASVHLQGADGGGDLSAFFATFDEQTAALAKAGWPIPRLVQRSSAAQETHLARSALRYTGQRGESGALIEVVAALQREDCKLAAARALVDAGAVALTYLAVAYWDVELASYALGALDAVEPAQQVAWIASAFKHCEGSSDLADTRRLAQPLLERLAALDASRELLALAQHPLLRRGEVLATFAQTPSADGALLAELRATRSPYSEELLLEALALRTPAEGFEWTLRRARSARQPLAGLLALASYPGVDPLRHMLEMRPSGLRGEGEALTQAWLRALERDASRFSTWIGDVYTFSDPAALRRLLEALILTESPLAAPALIALAGRVELGDEDRTRAALATGECGGPEHVALMAELLLRLERGEHALGAALVWSMHVLAGEAAVRAALEEVDGNLCARLNERLQSAHAHARQNATLLQLQRLLQPWLEGSLSIVKEIR